MNQVRIYESSYEMLKLQCKGSPLALGYELMLKENYFEQISVAYSVLGREQTQPPVAKISSSDDLRAEVVVIDSD